MAWKYAHRDGTRLMFATVDELKRVLPMPAGKKLILDFDEPYSKTKLIDKAKTWGGQVWEQSDPDFPLFEITPNDSFLTPAFNPTKEPEAKPRKRTAKQR